jgi:uncharacterized protein with ParB-like and HNH nuclease domain
MLKSELDAKTFGVGELITQRKLFVVPEHQRNFSWSVEEIEQYIGDVAEAFGRGASDYFIGLIVLQGPIEGAWHILDGQQRLATTTMLYSAIREWLSGRKLEADARQIETEFIGVRRLGGNYNPRLRLNTDNREIFEKFVTSTVATDDLRKQLPRTPRRSSNHRLLEGALFCRDWIDKYAANMPDSSTGASKLFALSAYFETRVKVVCVDVSTQTDAYILFESLNDRGADLSALDLVKNYIFSQIKPDPVDPVTTEWKRMAQNIEGRDADDFLKVFWTSKFGIIQKLDLFNRLRTTYPEVAGARRLVSELADASEKFEAIDDPEHELWAPFGWTCRQRIKDLKVLGSRQSRALVLGALTRFPSAEILPFLWLLIVTIMRYQVIGRGRTGVMEKEFSVLARAIHDGSVASADAASTRLVALNPADDVFQLDFSSHAEPKSARVHYILLELEAAHRRMHGAFSLQDYVELRATAANISPDFIVPKSSALSEEDDTIIHLIGNRVLLEDALNQGLLGLTFEEKREVFANSSLSLTRDVSEVEAWTRTNIATRSRELAEIAVKTWRFNDGFHNA